MGAFTLDELNSRLSGLYGDKYIFDISNYRNQNSLISGVCQKHGEFVQPLRNILRGNACQKCGFERRRLDPEIFKNRLKDMYSDMDYDFSNLTYVCDKIKVTGICLKHGEFSQYPRHLLDGHACPKCGREVARNNIRLTFDEFVERARSVHGDKYTYIPPYEDSRKEMKIICPIHGEFWQTPRTHLCGKGCPKCAESHLEREIRLMLDENHIEYIFQARKKDLKWIDDLTLDFYLPQHNIGIECQGKQHFEPINYWGGEKRLLKTQESDARKKGLCETNNLNLLYYGDKKYKALNNKLICDKNEVLNIIINS